MRCLLTTLAALFLAHATAHGQDMPLYSVLIEGEGWKEAGKVLLPRFDVQMPSRSTYSKAERAQRMTLYSSRRAQALELNAEVNEYFWKALEHPRGFENQMRPLSSAISPDGGTKYVGFNESRAVWAFRVDAEGKLSGGAPYCPLRLRKGQDGIEVTSLATDRVGRIFAATSDGIHFFDPTGRFSGLIFLPVPGYPYNLAFEDDRLVLEIGDKKYSRKLNTRGK